MSKTYQELKNEFECDISPETSTIAKCTKIIKEIPTDKKTHPLLNPDSSHYKMIGDTEAITYFEKMFTKDELLAWAKITAMKYRMRVGNKSQVDSTSDINKIKTYEDYYNYLKDNKQ